MRSRDRPRLLDLAGAGLAALRSDALADAIRASEGRVVVAEVVAGGAPLLGGTSNAELMAAFGADLVCLNLVAPGATGPLVPGLDGLEPQPDSFDGLARLLGRPVGLNLEPDLDAVPEAYRAGAAAIRTAEAGGAAFVVVTANPKRSATIDDIAKAVENVRAAAPEMLCLAGKMHQAGAIEVLDAGTAARLVDAGAHGVLVPLPGTVPGVSEAAAAEIVQAAHERGALAMGTIGTSQEGADDQTLRALALAAKRIGVDLHHVGDAGYGGCARPEAVYAYSIALRGVRHTWNRMARNVRASWK